MNAAAWEIKRALRNKADEICDLVQEIGNLESEIKDPDRSESYKGSARLRITTIRGKIGNMQNVVQDECMKIINKYRQQILSESRLRGGDITPDAQLFNVGVELPAQDLESIFDRSAGNYTMQRLCMMYARQHNLKDFHRAIVNQDAQELNGLENTSRLYIDHWIDNKDAFAMLEKFFPEASE